jgi:hypothetical protein
MYVFGQGRSITTVAGCSQNAAASLSLAKETLMTGHRPIIMMHYKIYPHRKQIRL